jgi:hypothetical protein
MRHPSIEKPDCSQTDDTDAEPREQTGTTA